MADPILCPRCNRVEAPAFQIGAVTVCGACGSSLVVEAGAPRPATGKDMDTLSEPEIKLLKAARGKVGRTPR